MQYILLAVVVVMVGIVAFVGIEPLIKRYWILGFIKDEFVIMGAFNRQQLSDNTEQIHQKFGGDFLVINKVFTSESKIMFNMLDRDQLNRFASRIQKSI